MAKATIEHYKNFEVSDAELFGEKVRLSVGLVVYGLDPEMVTPGDVTVTVIQAGPGSSSSASSGTEVTVDLADGEWPIDSEGNRLDVESAKHKCVQISHRVGELLLGGVECIPGAEVNVWARQFAATGWCSASDKLVDHRKSLRGRTFGAWIKFFQGKEVKQKI